MAVRFLAHYDYSPNDLFWLDTLGSYTRVVPRTLADNRAGTGRQNFPY